MNPLDPGILTTLQGLLGEKLSRIVGVFALQLPSSVSDLEACYTGGRLDELATKAHALKGSCANMGASELAALAAAIERAAKHNDLAALAVPVASLAETTEATLSALRSQGYWTD